MINSNPPLVFTRFCKIAGYSDTQTLSYWSKIYSNTYTDLFCWILSPESGLNPHQLALAEKAFRDQIISPKDNFLDRLIDKFPQEFQSKIANQLSATFITHLSGFESSTSSRLTPDEKQVINSFLKINGKL